VDALAALVRNCVRLLDLSRRPGHGAPAEKVEMQMVNSLSTVLPRVHHDPIAVAEALVSGNLRRYPEQVAKNRALALIGPG